MVIIINEDIYLLILFGTSCFGFAQFPPGSISPFNCILVAAAVVLSCKQHKPSGRSRFLFSSFFFRQLHYNEK